MFPPDEAVQDKADTENDTRIQGSCLQEQTQGKRKHSTLTRCFFLMSPLLGQSTRGGSIPSAPTADRQWGGSQPTLLLRKATRTQPTPNLCRSSQRASSHPQMHGELNPRPCHRQPGQAAQNTKNSHKRLPSSIDALSESGISGRRRIHQIPWTETSQDKENELSLLGKGRVGVGRTVQLWKAVTPTP